MEPSDEELLARALHKDREAFALLVNRYEVRLFNYARRIVGNAADAEDVFQETFLRVYNGLARFDPSQRFRPWVYSIATNVCRDMLRRQRRRPTVSIEALADAPGGAAGLSERIRSSGPDPAASAAAHELAARLESALSRLPIRHRAVFIMARYDGMRYDEIARTLRIPVGTVKSRMNKAAAFLLRELGEVEA